MEEVGALCNVFFQLAAAIQDRRQGFCLQRPLGSYPEIGLTIPGLKGDPAFLVLVLIAIESMALCICFSSLGNRTCCHSHSMVLGGFEEMS